MNPKKRLSVIRSPSLSCNNSPGDFKGDFFVRFLLQTGIRHIRHIETPGKLIPVFRTDCEDEAHFISRESLAFGHIGHQRKTIRICGPKLTNCCFLISFLITCTKQLQQEHCTSCIFVTEKCNYFLIMCN